MVSGLRPVGFGFAGGCFYLQNQPAKHFLLRDNSCLSPDASFDDEGYGPRGQKVVNYFVVLISVSFLAFVQDLTSASRLIVEFRVGCFSK